jgi:protein-disulfide isomerase
MKVFLKICICLPLFVTRCLYGQETLDGKKLDAILDELQQIHKLLENKPNITSETPARTARTVRIEVGNTPLLGLKNAPFTVVEFTDFQCKFCQQFYDNVFHDLKKLYIDTGKLRFYSMNLPLVEIHPASLLAAQAGHCATEQGGFWLIYDKMKRNSKDLEIATIIGYARDSGLNADAFQECIKSGRYKKEVEDSSANIKAKGARGTPTFVIGKSSEFGVEGELLTGAMPLDVFQKKLKDFGMDK